MVSRQRDIRYFQEFEEKSAKLNAKYLEEIKQRPPKNYSTETSHSTAEYKYTYIDDTTGYECRLIKHDDGIYRGYVTISSDHPYLDHENFDATVGETVKFFDNAAYGGGDHWGDCYNHNYYPGLDDVPNSMKYYKIEYINFQEAKEHLSNLALQLSKIVC